MIPKNCLIEYEPISGSRDAIYDGYCPVCRVGVLNGYPVEPCILYGRLYQSPDGRFVGKLLCPDTENHQQIIILPSVDMKWLSYEERKQAQAQVALGVAPEEVAAAVSVMGADTKAQEDV